MQSQRGYTRTLSLNDLKPVRDLLARTYQNSADFQSSAFDAQWDWSQSDSTVTVVGVFDAENALLSTMRAHFLSTPDALSQHTDLFVSLPNSLYPTLNLRKAATDSNHISRGLNSLLRYYILEAALRSDAKSLTGVVTEFSSRQKVLKDLGYEVCGEKRDDKGLHALSGLWQLMVLRLDPSGHSALDRLAELTKLLRQNYSWSGDGLKFH